MDALCTRLAPSPAASLLAVAVTQTVEFKLNRQTSLADQVLTYRSTEQLVVLC
jgi:hypothetical protein